MNEDPLGELRVRLRDLHLHAGEPSTRWISKRLGIGVLSHSTVATILKCTSTPQWKSLQGVVAALGGDREEFLALWIAAREAADHRPIGPDGGFPVTDQPGGPRPAGTGDLSSFMHAEMTPRLADGDSERARTVAVELARRDQDQRRAEREHGHRDGVELAREIPTYELRQLAEHGFDVVAWIRPLRDQWSRFAASLDGPPERIPSWATAAAQRLGHLADPIGTDEYSFARSDAYLRGLGEGLRAVHTARGDLEATAASASARDGERLARGLGDLMQGHAGLSLAEVEQAGQTLVVGLKNAFEHARGLAHLPAIVRVAISAFQTSHATFTDDDAYRVGHGPSQGLKIVAEVASESFPDLVRAECTPLVGIARSRQAAHGLTAMDANRPARPRLKLGMLDAHPGLSPEAEQAIADWADDCVAALLADLHTGVGQVLARLGYATDEVVDFRQWAGDTGQPDAAHTPPAR